jgi:flavodoxin
MQKPKRPAEELAEMIRDGLAEEGFDVLVHSNPRTGWDVAIISDNENEGAQSSAEAIAAELRQWYDLGDVGIG